MTVREMAGCRMTHAGGQVKMEWVRPAYGWSSSLAMRRNRRVFGSISDSTCSCGLVNVYGNGWCRMSHESSSVKMSSNDIGAEYGEGFMKFHPTGEKIRLDVDTLNEDLKVRGADRMRHLMYPDESFGLIFDFDNVIVDALSLRKNAWRKVASASGLKLPAIERPNMYSLLPEKAVMDVLRWTDDIRKAKDFSWQLSQAYVEEVSQNSQLCPGVERWLKSMQEFHIPCALVSTLGRETLQGVLKRLDIFDKFSAIGAADDDMETKAQQYLSATISICRPPEQCIVFGASPEAIAAAHNCTMRAVAVIGPCTAPQLRSADLTVASLDELSVYNIRRLFANRGNEFMDLKMKFSQGGETKRKLRHGTST